MPLDASLFQHLQEPDGRRAVIHVHTLLRGLILSGKLTPGTVLSQVEVARVLGVSRTPIREALRLLQQGNLISAEPNLRCRVLGFDPRDIEALYIQRIMVEAVAVQITTERMRAADLQALRKTVKALESPEAHDRFDTWMTLHHRFHQQIVAGVGAPLVNDLEALELRSARYQSAYRGKHLTGWWQRGEVEHREIAHAMARRDASRARTLAARHLARTALELLAALAPDHDTTALQTSVCVVTALPPTPVPAGRKPASRAASPSPRLA